MTSEVLPQTVGAGATVTFGRGRIFNLLQASSPVTITLEGKSVHGGQTSIRKFVNIPAGSKFIGKAGEEWTFLRLTSALAQTVTLFVGDDDMSFNNAVTVSGVAVVAITPSSGITDQAGVAATVTGQHAFTAANLARKRVTLWADPTNTATVYLRTTGGANDIGFLQAGTYAEFDTTAGFDYRDPSAGGQKLYISEES
jgi:hypothetical protein